VKHEGIVRTRIHQFKFEGQTEWIPPLIELLEIACAGSEMPLPELILPVPLHIKRLKERGFNQSGLLAGELARKLGVPVCLNAMVRKNWTQPQTGLTRNERLKNVRGAFELTGERRVRGRRILLVDDVFTTGTTLSECARILKKKGRAAEVRAITVTRALLG
jgi:ComF family protein